MSWVDHKDDYLPMVGPSADVVLLTTKSAWPWKVIAWFLFLTSFGQFKRETFLQGFATTFGPLQGYPEERSDLSRRLLRHEGRHSEQALMFGWFIPLFGWLGRKIRVWVGLLPMGIVYGFLPLPIGLAYGRYRLELDADRASWIDALQRGEMSPGEVLHRAESFGQTVNSKYYLWSWPWAASGFRKAAKRVIKEHAK